MIFFKEAKRTSHIRGGGWYFKKYTPMNFIWPDIYCVTWPIPLNLFLSNNKEDIVFFYFEINSFWFLSSLCWTMESAIQYLKLIKNYQYLDKKKILNLRCEEGLKGRITTFDWGSFEIPYTAPLITQVKIQSLHK